MTAEAATAEAVTARRAGVPPWRAVTRIAIVVELVIIVVGGTLAVFHLPEWSPVDEAAHYSYVEEVAVHHALPVLGRTPMQANIPEIGHFVRPSRAPGATPAQRLGSYSYEAFQPPLYYLVAAPFSDLATNGRTKVTVLRFLGFGFLLLSALLLARLSFHALGRRAEVGLAAGLAVLALPGVVARFVTVSNLGLEVVLTIACITELYLAWTRMRSWRLLSGGVLLGLALVTQLTTVILLPVAAVVGARVLWRHHRPADLAWAGGGVAAIAALLVPWLAWNERTYHTLTANQLAVRMQRPVQNPHHLHYDVGTVVTGTVRGVLNVAGLREFPHLTTVVPVLGILGALFAVLVVPVGLVLVCSLGRRVWAGGWWVLATPYVLTVLLLWWITVGQQWDVLLARYTYPALPSLAVVAAGAALERLPWPRPVVLTTAALAVVPLIWWAWLVPNRLV